MYRIFGINCISKQVFFFKVRKEKKINRRSEGLKDEIVNDANSVGQDLLTEVSQGIYTINLITVIGSQQNHESKMH